LRRVLPVGAAKSDARAPAWSLAPTFAGARAAAWLACA
jgi:hypothetical protein